MNTHNTNNNSIRTKILNTIAGTVATIAVVIPNYSNAQTTQTEKDTTNNTILSNLELSFNTGIVMPYTDLGSSELEGKDGDSHGKYSGINVTCPVIKNTLNVFISANNSEFDGGDKGKNLIYKTQLNDFLIGTEITPLGTHSKVVPLLTIATGYINSESSLKENGKEINYVGNNGTGLGGRNNNLVYNIGGGLDAKLNDSWTAGLRVNWTKMGGKDGYDLLDAYDPQTEGNKYSDGYWRVGVKLGCKLFK